MEQDQARALITRLLGTSNPIDLHPFEFGWVAKERLSDRERATGMGVGLGTFIIDRDEIVTAHRSLPPPLIMKAYAEARRQGRITGQQIWPEPAPEPGQT